MNPIFYRTAFLIVNTFAWCEGGNSQICFCNWNSLLGPAPGNYALVGTVTARMNILLSSGILFCPSEYRKMMQYLTDNATTIFTII